MINSFWSAEGHTIKIFAMSWFTNIFLIKKTNKDDKGKTLLPSCLTYPWTIVIFLERMEIRVIYGKKGIKFSVITNIKYLQTIMIRAFMTLCMFYFLLIQNLQIIHFTNKYNMLFTTNPGGNKAIKMRVSVKHNHLVLTVILWLSISTHSS